MKVIIQVYEIQDPHEAEKLIEIGVDHIGSIVLDEDSWKLPDLRDVISLTRHTDSASSMIFLFHKQDNIYRAIDYYQPDIVHLCEDLVGKDGNYDDNKHLENQKRLREKFPEVQIMRSIPVPPSGREPSSSADLIPIFEPYSDLFLIDTYLPEAPVTGYIGITGIPCDWETGSKIVEQSSIPVILGGGLNPSNVYEALSSVGPFGVDSCTGTNATDLEGNPIRFKKDLTKVRAFINECRRYEASFGC